MPFHYAKLHYKAVPFTKFKEPDLEPSTGIEYPFARENSPPGRL